MDEIEIVGNAEWLRRLAHNLKDTPNVLMRRRLLECADELDELNAQVNK